MLVMGQLCDGSHGSRVTKDDPFKSLHRANCHTRDVAVKVAQTEFGGRVGTGGLGTEVPQWVPRQNPMDGLRQSPQKPDIHRPTQFGADLRNPPLPSTP